MGPHRTASDRITSDRIGPHNINDPGSRRRTAQLVDSLYREADRVLCGRGTHMLRPNYQRHRVTVEQWMAMTKVQRQRARDSCFVLPQLSATGTSQSVSTDGKLRVN